MYDNSKDIRNIQLFIFFHFYDVKMGSSKFYASYLNAFLYEYGIRYFISFYIKYAVYNTNL